MRTYLVIIFKTKTQMQWLWTNQRAPGLPTKTQLTWGHQVLNLRTIPQIFPIAKV